jgi:hypothetical protein
MQLDIRRPSEVTLQCPCCLRTVHLPPDWQDILRATTADPDWDGVLRCRDGHDPYPMVPAKTAY